MCSQPTNNINSHTACTRKTAAMMPPPGGSLDLQQWWRGRRFLLPPAYGGHEHRWTYISFGVVGCELCGTIHACEHGSENAVPCAKVYNADSSAVCAFTAVVIEASVLMDATIDVDSYNKNREDMFSFGNVRRQQRQSSFGDNMASIAHEVETSVHLVLYSARAQACRIAEVQRYKRKLDAALENFAHKNRGQRVEADLVLAFEHAICALRGVRVPAVKFAPPPCTQYAPLQRALITMLSCLRIVDPNAGRINPERVRMFVVGLLYVAIHGISARGVQLLPAHPELAQHMPLQSMLNEFFNVHSKLVTESENLIKRCINDADDHAFRVFVGRMQHALQRDANAE